MKRFVFLLLASLALASFAGCQTETDEFKPPQDRRVDPKPWNAPSDWQNNYISPY